MNEELQAIFGAEEKIEFHRLLQFLKPHLLELKPLTITVPIRRDQEVWRRQYAIPVAVQSKNQKKLLAFLAEHNFDFETFEDEPTDDSSLTTHLKKRELKCNRKIAASIEQMRRVHHQMEFFSKIAESPR